MYKLFLCLRYLRSRVIAYFAVLGVALCVFMVLVSISVMNGFLRKIELAAKGLFGDIVVESTSLGGLGRYDEFVGEVRRRVPEVEATSPFILTFGILRVPGGNDYRQTVQIAGIRLPERADVSDFKDGLFVQGGVPAPTFDPPAGAIIARLRDEIASVERIRREALGPGSKLSAEQSEELERRTRTALSFQESAVEVLQRFAPAQAKLRDLQAKLEAARAAGRDKEADDLASKMTELAEQVDCQGPANRAILGLGIPGLSVRTEQGQTLRYIVPGHNVVLSLLPLGRKMSPTDITPNTATFTVVDDSRTDVWSIDSNIVYVPFEALQELNNMGAERDETGKVVVPPRCSMIHVKVRKEFAAEPQLDAVCSKVRDVWLDFRSRHPDAASLGTDASVLTWRQRQAKIIAPIEQQRTLVAIMFGIISMVAVVLVFVIFYMIVVQKTKDIGILKAVGASDGGVAQIFLAYGAAIGLVGSVIGTIGGYYFVRNINAVRDAMERWFGFGVWSKEWFLFEKIPNEVEPLAALMIVLGAIVAGVVGAMIPAVRAARMEPVEALRYE